MIKRVFLFLLTNIAIIAVFSIILAIFNVGPHLTQYGLNYQSLLVFALIFGFTGAFISLFLSKFMAKRAYSIRIINKPGTDAEMWLIEQIKRMAKQRNIGMPEVGVYESPEPNAFATGWNKNNALVAVSTSIMEAMDADELEGVLGHEISHVANGDMVTMTLLQGVLNTFVIFFARVAAFFLTQFFRRDGEEFQGGFVYYSVAFVFELIFGVLATIIVMWFSRHREYRADLGSAKYVGKDKMIKSLRRLQELVNRVPVDNRAPALEAMKISSQSRWLALFSSHPPIEKRIEVLEKLNRGL